MDEKQLQLLWDSHAKNGGFSSFQEFKNLMMNGASRKVYFDDANSKLGFKDYDEFETILNVKKKVGGEKPKDYVSVPQSTSPISYLPSSPFYSPTIKKAEALPAQKQKLIQLESIQELKRQTAPVQDNVISGQQRQQLQKVAKSAIDEVQGIKDLPTKIEQYKKKKQEAVANSVVDYFDPKQFLEIDITGDGKEAYQKALGVTVGMNAAGIVPSKEFEDAASFKTYFGERLNQLNEKESILRNMLKGVQAKNQYESPTRGDISSMQKPPIDLQGIVREETPQNEQEINDALNVLKEYKNNLYKMGDFYAKKLAKKAAPKGNNRQLAKAYGEIMNDEYSMELNRFEEKGIPIRDEDKLNQDLQGLEVRRDDLEERYSGKEKDDAYFQELYQIEQGQKDAIHKYPELKKQRVALLIAQELGDDAESLVAAASTGNENAIKKISEKTGIPKKDVLSISTGDLPSESFLSNVGKSLYGSATGLLTGGIRFFGGAFGADPDRLTYINRGISESGNEIFGDNPYEHTVAPETIINKDLQVVKNPNAGKYNYNAATIKNFAGQAIGGLVGFFAGTKGLGYLGMGERAALWTNVIASGYENNYQKADEVLGKDASEKSKAQFALITGAIEAAAFEFLPKEKLGLKISKNEIKEFGDIVGKTAISKINKEALTKWTEKVLQGTLKSAGEAGKVTAAMNASKIVNGILRQQFGDKEGFNEAAGVLDPHRVGEEFFGLMLPLGLAEIPKAIKHSRQFKESLYDAATSPDIYRTQIKQAVELGRMTPEEGELRLKTVDALANISSTVPAINPETNAPLTHNQKVEYTYNRVKESAIQSAKEGVKGDEALVQLYSKNAKELVDERKAIIDGTHTEYKNTVELYDRIKEKGTHNKTLAAGTKTEGVKYLSEQALTTPNGVKNQLKGDAELTTDLIALNEPFKIKEELSDLKQKHKKLTDQEKYEEADELDRHITLLEEGLEKTKKKEPDFEIEESVVVTPPHSNSDVIEVGEAAEVQKAKDSGLAFEQPLKQPEPITIGEESIPVSESKVAKEDVTNVKIGEFEKDEMLSMIENRKDTVEEDPESSFGIESEQGALDKLKQKIESGENSFTKGELEWLKSEADDLLEKTQAAIEADGNPEAKRRLPSIKKFVSNIEKALSTKPEIKNKTGQGGTETAASVLNIPDFPLPKKPVDEMTAAELDNHISEVKNYQKESKLTKEQEDNLTPEQQAKYYGKDLPKDGVYDPVELQRIRNRVQLIEDAETMQDVADTIKRPLIDYARKQDTENLAVIKAAKRKADELGFSPNDFAGVIKEKLKGEFGDNADAMSKIVFDAIEKKVVKIPETVLTEEVLQTEGKTVETGEAAGGGKEPPKKNDFLYSPNEQKRTSGLMRHLLEAENVAEDFKKGIKEKGLDKYEVANNAEAREVARQVVDSLGKEDALQVARMEDMHPSVRSAIYAEVIDTAFRAEQEAKKKGDKEAQMDAAAEWASVSKEYDKKLTSGGQFTAYAAHFYKQSPLGFVLKSNEQIAKKFEDYVKDKDTNLQEVFKMITETEGGKKLLTEKVEALRKEERKAERKKRDKKIDDFFDGLKASKDILYSAPIPPSVWNGAMDVLKIATKGGDRVVEAVQKAIEHITKNVGDDWDKERFRKEYEKKLSDIVDEGKSEKSYEQVLRGRAEELRRRIKEGDFSSEEYKEKKQLSEKEMEAKKELEEVEKEYKEARKKSPEYIDKKAKQYLDMVRGRLKDMNEKQKEDFIRRVSKKIIENGGLRYDEFKKELADVMGFKELTPEQIARAEELTKDINGLDEIENKMVENPTEQSILDYVNASNKAIESQNELFNMVARKTDIMQTFKSWYVGSLLGVQSLFINTLFNPVQQLSVRFPKSVLLNLTERGAKAISMAMSKATGTPIYDPKLSVLDAQKGYFGSFKPAAKNAWFNFKKGTENRDLFGKNEYQTSLSPRLAAEELAKFKKGEIYLTPVEVIDRKIRSSIFARQADVILRGMQFGDVIPRWMAEGAKSIQIAKNELKITDPVELDAFMYSPEKMAKQILLKQGKSPELAAKLAAEIKERIVFEGQKAVMQEGNILKSLSAGADRGLVVSEKDEPGMKLMKNVGSAAKTLTFPFIGIPANLAWQGFKLVNPEVSLAMAISQTAISISKGKKGDMAASKKYMEMAKDNFAHSVLGLTYLYAASALVNAGLTRSSNDEETSIKERAGESVYGKQNQFDIGKAMGGESFWVDNKFMGLFGTMLDVKSKQKDAALKEKAKTGEEIKDESWINDFAERVGYSGIAQLNNLVFNNGSKMVSAINGGDAPFRNWVTQTTNGVSNMFTGGTYSAFSKAVLPEQTQAKGENMIDDIINSQKQKNVLLRLAIDKFGGNGMPPSKISIWGEPIKNDRSISGVLGSMLGWEKDKRDVFGAIIYDDYRRSGNTNFFPMPEDAKFSVNGKQVKLTPQQKQDLDVFVGQARKTFAKAIALDMTVDYNGKKYSELKDDQDKIDFLSVAYKMGKQIGYENFIKKYPQFAKVEDFNKELEKEKRDMDAEEVEMKLERESKNQ